MASTSAVDDTPGTEEHVFDEDIEEETVWMDEDEAHKFAEDNKRIAYDERQSELTANETAEEYHEVDVEEYDEASYRSNLPDLLSKRLQCENGSTMTLCFSKKGCNQLAVDGFLYNISHSDGTNSTWVCINPECTAHILSINEMTSLDKDNDVHHEMCVPDEAQLRLRIAIYDLRLVAEFTDVRLDILYENFATSFAQENPSLAELFPSFDAICGSLSTHRRNKIFRRHFDSEALADEDKDIDDIDIDDEDLIASMNGEQVVEESYSETIPMDEELAIIRQLQLNPYGRPRGFPATYCMDCGIEMTTSARCPTPQHGLADHVHIMHQPIKIHTFVFEPAAFEMWLREVQRCPALRFRRFHLIGEDMYYLCACDLRLQRSKYTRKCHCSAFVKIADYRRVSARKSGLVSIEYSFEHFYHDIISDSERAPEQLIAEMRPEEFLFQLERRKQSTANLVRSRIEMNSRRQAIANSLQSASRIDSWTGIRMTDDVFSRRATMTRSLAVAAKPPALLAIRSIGTRPLDPNGLITRKSNFEDEAVYDSVKQFEQLSHIVIRRLQSVRSVAVADRYAETMRKMLNQIVTDPDCTQDGSAQIMWCGLSPSKNGVNPATKRAKEEEEGEESERKRARMEEEKEERESEKEAEEDREEEEEDVEEDEEIEGKGESPKKKRPVEEEKKGVKTRGRTQLPVKNTLMAARVVEKEKGKVEGDKVLYQSPRRRTNSLPMKEDAGKSLPEITPRSKSTRIQARK